MNKRYFTALIATFFMAVSAIAQTNTYNMVLTLTDGTVITIGPNDLKQLDFRKGDVTVSGTNITDLMNQMKDLQASLVAVQNEVAAAVAQIKNNKAELQADISNLAESVNALDKSVDAKIAANNAEMKAYTNDAVAANRVQLQESINMLLAEIAKNKEVITNDYLEAIDISKAVLQELMNEHKDMLQEQIDQNTEDINTNKASIKTNTAGIDTNKNAIKALITQLRNLGVIPKN